MTTSSNTPIPLHQIKKKLWTRKFLFLKVWIITFVLSVAYIVPQPRLYSASVLLAPEMSSGEQVGSLSALASSFGINLDSDASLDAIYPELYPEFIASNNFIVSLFDIQVQTIDGEIQTDLYTYLLKHQKRTFYMKPIYWVKLKFKNWVDSKRPSGSGEGKSGINPSFLTEEQFNIAEMLKGDIVCNVDPLTNVISLKVNAQDPLVAACLADSICMRLQGAITNYRTNKARVDVEHYHKLVISSKEEYFATAKTYSDFCDSHKNITQQTTQTEHDKLALEMSMALHKYQAMVTQLETSRAKLQEATPAFTTLQNASVPLRPSAPKRVFFCLAMLILATIGTTYKVLKNEIYSTIIFFSNDKGK